MMNGRRETQTHLQPDGLVRWYDSNANFSLLTILRIEKQKLRAESKEMRELNTLKSNERRKKKQAKKKKEKAKKKKHGG